MKNYLFRGLRTDGEGWVYGDLINLHDGRKFIINNKFGACIDNKGNFINTESPFVNEVIPETVGQFTGLTVSTLIDNDNMITIRIFVGDKFVYELNGKHYESVVIFRKGSYGFNENGYFFALKDMADSQDNLDNFEIIGNIHEDTKDE